jgi:uncharacterized protein
MPGELFSRLHLFLRQYKSVAVAFSGGVDSTVLLHNCCRIFPPGQIMALHASSCLHSASAAAITKKVVAAHFAANCDFVDVPCAPMAWPDFIVNDNNRCYFCKNRTFRLLLAEADSKGIPVLLDGTNMSDLDDYRPGMKAAQELGVISPFLEVGIAKNDIREYARREGLINHDLPSNSCLATRIPTGNAITIERLAAIEKAEEFLSAQGFHGVRVRIFQGFAHIELFEGDLLRMFDPSKRRIVAQYFQDSGLGKPYIGLLGR